MKKILVVDDESLCGLLLKTALSAEGYLVESAATVAQALELGKSFLPDLLITDWMLADSHDGISLARELQCFNPALKVILITGMEEDRVKKQADDLRFDGVMVKPLDLDLLLPFVKSRLDPNDLTAPRRAKPS